MKFILPILMTLLLFSCGKSTPDQHYAYFRNYMSNFNDLNYKHLRSAKKVGIKPGIDTEEAKDQLNEISSCGIYAVDPLTHSIPYLTDGAEELLEMISNNFIDSLSAKGLTTYKPIVTSVLRSKESVAKLRKENINASANSAHLYGTTFDIAYARFEKKGWGEEVKMELLKSNLADVIFDLKKAGLCHVKYEFRQGCFHITSTK